MADNQRELVTINTDPETLTGLQRTAFGGKPTKAHFGASVDRPSTLFYLDPPYWGYENDYGKGLFNRDDFAVLPKLKTPSQAAS